MYDWALLRYASLFSSGLLLHPPARRRPGIKRARKIPVKRFISPPYHLLQGKYHRSEQRERNMLRRSAHAAGWPYGFQLFRRAVRSDLSLTSSGRDTIYQIN
jgi:hypothetical protein